MKYGLRALLVVVATVSALLVGRIEYLRGWAEFHEREARRYADMIGTYRNITPLEVDSALEVAAENPDDCRLDHKFHVVFHHRATADRYHQAAYRPWTIVHEPPLPERHYDD
ncbi:MAG: hypothetical protein ACR2FY_10410 [Pirellulaceae bacterium]